VRRARLYQVTRMPGFAADAVAEGDVDLGEH
jgi:hypothetical protein